MRELRDTRILGKVVADQQAFAPFPVGLIWGENTS
jgi:hypothetical protein